MTPTSFVGLFKNGLTVGAGSLFIAASCMGQNHVLKGQGKAGDWQSDAPGVEHRISISDLPPDYATPSAYNRPKVVAPPKGAKPSVPKGFDVALFASGFANPRFGKAAFTVGHGTISEITRILVIRAPAPTWPVRSSHPTFWCRHIRLRSI